MNKSAYDIIIKPVITEASNEDMQNRKYTFKPTGHVVRDMLLVALFYAVFTPASTWLGNLLEGAGVHDWLVQLIIMCSNLVTEYLFQKFVVYKEKAE